MRRGIRPCDDSEKYSRGRRGAPAKGIGRVTGARVRIPLSPLKFQDDFILELFISIREETWYKF